MLKLAVLDCETTGLDNRRHGLLTVAGKILIKGEVVSKFEFRMRPFDEDEITEEALEVNGLKKEDIFKYPLPEEVLPKMKEYFYQFIDHDDPKDLLTMVGFNVTFDQGFLRSFFFKLGALNSFKNIFHYKTIDTQAIVLGYLFANDKDVEMESFHQFDCARAIGINVDDESLHDADYDSSLTMMIFDRMLEKLKDK